MPLPRSASSLRAATCLLSAAFALALPGCGGNVSSQTVPDQSSAGGSSSAGSPSSTGGSAATGAGGAPAKGGASGKQGAPGGSAQGGPFAQGGAPGAGAGPGKGGFSGAGHPGTGGNPGTGASTGVGGFGGDAAGAPGTGAGPGVGGFAGDKPSQGGSTGTGAGPGTGGFGGDVNPIGTGGNPGTGAGPGTGGFGGDVVGTGAGGSAGASGACNSTNCQGCCDVAGICRPGTDPVACGLTGVTCTNCASVGFNCTADGVCQGAKPSCSPSNCAGCCDGQGVCRFGTELDACGASGSACVACAAGLGCAGGACMGPPPACSAATCGGCCDGAGNCQPGTAKSACGEGGQACQSCSAPGSACAQPGHFCEVLPGCNSTDCPSGCCDDKGFCQLGTSNNQCGTNGQACSDCGASNQACASQGFCFSGQHCGPDTCAGCCTLTGECMGGGDPNACGQYGGVCDNCAGKMETCQGFVCSGGATCPAAYAGCNPSNSTPPPKKSTSCSAQDIAAVEMACSGVSVGPSCGKEFAALLNANPSCYSCLLPFGGNQAYTACLAPYLSPSCNHQLTCESDCSAQACKDCNPAQSTTCQSAVFGNGGACSAFNFGYYCAQAALKGPAAFCDFAAYGNDFGKWIASVGTHYCAE